jgi:outer membrane protein assembly factor BamB
LKFKNTFLLVSTLIILLFGTVLFLSTSILSQDGPPDPSNLSFELMWSTPPNLRVPESVIYDKSNEILYVSSINGSFNEPDGNGFISILSLEGEILNRNWITDLNAPKGMAIFGGKLYVADLRELVEIDIESGAILAKYSPDRANFMNDVAVSEDGTIYVTDTFGQRIYRFIDGDITTIVEDSVLDSINGIIVDGDQLLTGSLNAGLLFSINLEDLEIMTLLGGFGGFDGIVPDGHGRFWVSDFGGRIYLTDLEESFQILSSIPGNAADIEYVIDQQLLLIPTFNGNQVLAYKLTISE